MMKYTSLGLAVTLAVLLAFVHPSFSDINLGLSVYNSSVTVEAGKSLEFAVGRVYNVGNNSIWVTSAISGINVSVTVLTSNVTVKPGDSFEVVLEASNITLAQDVLSCTWTGQVNLQGHGFEPVTSGNPVLPGGTLPFNVTVTKNAGQQKQDTLPLIVFIGCILGIALTLGIYVEWTRLKRREL
jgi:hypothetical protein